MPKTLLIDAIKATKNNSNRDEVYAALSAAYKQQPYIGTSVLNSDEETPLIVAAKESHLFAVEWLLDDTQHPGRTFKDAAIDHADASNMTALCHSVNYPDRGPLEAKELPDGTEIRRKIIDLLIVNKAHVTVIQKESGLLTPKILQASDAFQVAKDNYNFYFLEAYFNHYFYKLEYAEFVTKAALVDPIYEKFVTAIQFQRKITEDVYESDGSEKDTVHYKWGAKKSFTKAAPGSNYTLVETTVKSLMFPTWETTHTLFDPKKERLVPEFKRSVAKKVEEKPSDGVELQSLLRP